jgi:hypothetical protein
VIELETWYSPSALRKLVCGGAEIGFGRVLERVGGRGYNAEARVEAEVEGWF